MALASTLTFGKIKLLLENPAVPGVFTQPCGFIGRGITRSKNFNETITPDCGPDEDAPSVVERDLISVDWSFEGNGPMNEESYPTYEAFYDSSVPWNIRIEIQFAGALGLKAFTSRAHLSQLPWTGEKGQRWQQTISLVGAAKLTPVA